MSNEKLFAPKAAAQMLRSWKGAGLDFVPRSGRILQPQASPGTTIEATASLVNSQEVIDPNIDPEASTRLLDPTLPKAAQEKASIEMPRPKKTAVSTITLDESKSIWPDDTKLGKEARIALLDGVRAEVVKCTLCTELAGCRTQTVFGVGNVRPRLCFFGEAPGADEDKQGEPFVGRAGQLLDKIIEAMTLQRGEVYILNTLKCRPPGNRTPLPDEVENCRPFFTRQLEILRPQWIVCLGTCAAQALLRTKETIGKLRGRSHDYRGIKVYATYHPAYLLRNPPAKRDVWEDMKIVMKEMGIAVPKT